MTSVYEQIGRRAVEILSTAQFAVQPPGSEKVNKKKNCKKGLSCNFTCIAADKTCRVSMTMEQQRAAAEIRKAAGRKATATAEPEKGGGLATVPKPEPPKEKKPPTSINDEIDRKYASANPTDEDVSNWVNERVKAHFEPTPENINNRTAKELKRRIASDYEYRVGVNEGKFSKRIVDKNSYIKAKIAAEQWEKKKDPEAVKRRTNPQHWVDSLMARGDNLKPSDIPKLEERVAKTKSEAVRRTARRDLESLKADEARRPEVEARARELAATWERRYNGSSKQRAKELGEEFDSLAVKAKTNMETQWGKIQSGRKSALEDARDEALNLDLDRKENPAKPGTYLRISDNDIKDHLVGLSEKFAADQFKGKTKADVRREYRDQAAKLHPDNQETGNAEAFRKLTNAYNRKIQEFD